MRELSTRVSMRLMSALPNYAVSWNDDGAEFIGYAELGDRELRLEGRDAGGREGLRTVPYRDIQQIEVSRLNGRRTVELGLAPDGHVIVSSLDRPGSLREFADRLRTLTDSPHH